MNLESEKHIRTIIREVLEDSNYLYHGTYDGAGVSIQRDNGMKIRSTNEPYLSFSSDIKVANYYAQMKGGQSRGIILRTPKTSDFVLSPKYNENKGFEWITDQNIPIENLEIKSGNDWIPLSKWDFIDKKPLS